MKIIAFLLLVLFPGAFFYAQKPPVPRFNKHLIGSSKVSAYFPEESPIFEESYSPDSSIVITYESQLADHSFALVQVDFREQVTDSIDRENLLVMYLDYLKDNFGVIEAAGYGKGHRLESYPQVQGVIDYWRDMDGNDYSIKGWITSEHLTVFMLYGTGEYPYPTAQEMYFNGIRY